MQSEIIDGIEYRYVVLRNRGKLITKTGNAINPIRRKQKATIHINQDGYPCFGGGVPVHMYVAHGWVDGYFEGAEINHKDFNRLNYNAENLEWVTHKENLLHTLNNNYDCVCKSKQGENNGRHRFTIDQVKQIRQMYDNGHSIVDIIKYYYPELQEVKDYKRMHSTVSAIARRKTWKCVS